MKINMKFAAVLNLALFLILTYSSTNAAVVADNCSATSTSNFTFSVEPAISITVTNPVLQNLCPGCSRTWSCGNGPFIEWDVTGSLECLYEFKGGRVIHCVGDNNASITGCWKQLAALPNTYEDYGFDDPRTFFNSNGQGVGAFRYYLTSQSSNCNASGSYCWCITATVNYACPFDQEIQAPCPTCPM